MVKTLLARNCKTLYMTHRTLLSVPEFSDLLSGTKTTGLGGCSQYMMALQAPMYTNPT